MNKRLRSLLAVSCAFVALMAGCISAPVASAPSKEMMLELNKRFASGEISKEQYDRERAELDGRTRRDAIQPGSPTTEAIRGMRTR